MGGSGAVDVLAGELGDLLAVGAAAKEQNLTHEEIAEELEMEKYRVDTHSERAGKKVRNARALLNEAGDA